MQANPKSPRRARVECGNNPNPPSSGFEIQQSDARGGRRWQRVAAGVKNVRLARADAKALEGGIGPGDVRRSFSELGEEWLKLQTHLRPRTHDLYRTALQRHLAPRIGT